MRLCEYYCFSSECLRRQELIVEGVDCFYKDLATLIGDYVKQAVKIGQMMDVFDETEYWRKAYVVGIRNNFIGVHYNGYNCRYDDWIHYKSFRLAPICEYSNSNLEILEGSSYLNISTDQHKWCLVVYRELLLKPLNSTCRLLLSNQVVDKAKDYYTGLRSDNSEIITILRSLDECIEPNQHNLILAYPVEPLTFCPAPLGSYYNKQILEKKAEKIVE